MNLSISVSKGAGNIKHNKRAHAKCPANVNSERSYLNVALVDENIRSFYKREFGEAVADYNSKQKRADRKIDDYYSKIAHDKKTKLFQELVIQVGNKDEQAPVEVTNKIYKGFLDDFRLNYPQLKVVGAYIHNDEATPHMHIDYVPVAYYAKGMVKRVANNKALEQMGFDDWQEWHISTMKTLEGRLNEMGIERDYKNNHNKHIERVEEFKELERQKDQLKKEVQELEQQKVESPLHEILEDDTVQKALDEFKQLVDEKVEDIDWRSGAMYEQDFDDHFHKNLGRNSYTVSDTSYKIIKESYYKQAEKANQAQKREWLELRIKDLEKIYRSFLKLVDDIKRSPKQAIIDRLSLARVDRLERENKELKQANEALESQNKALWRELHPEPVYQPSNRLTRVYGLKNDDLEHEKEQDYGPTL